MNMSIDSIGREIANIEKEISDLTKKISDQTRIESDKTSRKIQIANSINKNTSSSSLKSKYDEISRYEKAIGDSIKKRADYEKRKSDKTKILLDKRRRLSLEEKAQEGVRKREFDRIKSQYTSLVDELQTKKQIEEAEIRSTMSRVSQNIKYDIFISHASEDKENFVEPLYKELTLRGISVFYDKESIKWGDSIRQRIDKGLTNCKFAIVVLSKAFCSKKWTSDELSALFSMETTERKIILPIWYDITKQEVLDYSPLVAGKSALKTSDFTIEEIADNIKELLNQGD